MIARSPVSGSWQKATCSWVNGSGDGGSTEGAREDMGGDSASIDVRGDDRTSTLIGGFGRTCPKPRLGAELQGTVSVLNGRPRNEGEGSAWGFDHEREC